VSRKPQPWFRFYVETFGDRKIRRLPLAQRWVWAAVLGAARESPEPGRLYIAPGVPMTVKELAEYADAPLGTTRKALEEMGKLGMVTIDGEVIVAANWNKRQFESDNVTERVRDHRERSKEQERNVPSDGTYLDGRSDSVGYPSVKTEQNVSKTPVSLDHKRAPNADSRGGSPVRNVARNVARNAPETETETETEEEQGGKPPAARKRAHQLPDNFAPNDANKRIANERGVDLRAAFDNFTDHHRAKGSTFKDWHLAFNTWLRRERPSVHPIRPTYRPPEVHELEQPPDGLSPAEYAAWEREQRAKRVRA